MLVCCDHRLLGFGCVLAIFIACASGDYDTRGRESLSENGGERTPQEGNDCVGNNCVKRTINSSPGAMWFGPRLGRRRRSGRKPEKIEAFFDSTNAQPWIVVSIPDSDPVTLKIQDSEFKPKSEFLVQDKKQIQMTPRLGRELAELLYGEFEEFTNQAENQDLYEEVRSRPSIKSRFDREDPFLPPPRLGRQVRQLLARI